MHRQLIMTKLPRWTTAVLLFGAAAVCYTIGFTPGFGVFLALGLLFELGFWFKVFERDKNKS